MAANRSFFFPASPIVAPVVCTLCGENAHCIRRQGTKTGEIQTFECRCGNTEVRVRGDEISDVAIQDSIEKRVQGGKL
jgi:hypothetical protein